MTIFCLEKGADQRPANSLKMMYCRPTSNFNGPLTFENVTLLALAYRGNTEVPSLLDFAIEDGLFVYGGQAGWLR